MKLKQICSQGLPFALLDFSVSCSESTKGRSREGGSVSLMLFRLGYAIHH